MNNDLIASTTKIHDGVSWLVGEYARLKEENRNLREYVGHLESCTVCNEGIHYGMCNDKNELRTRAEVGR